MRADEDAMAEAVCEAIEADAKALGRAGHMHDAVLLLSVAAAVRRAVRRAPPAPAWP